MNKPTSIGHIRELTDRHRLSQAQIARLTGHADPVSLQQEKLRQLAFTGFFIKLTDMLRDRSFWFVPLKGPLLSYRLYQDPTIRSCHDIDLLVREEDIDTIRSLLLASGFGAPEPDWPHKPRQQKARMRLMHHIMLVDTRQHIVVELHWRISQHLPVSRRRYEKHLQAQLSTVEFQRRSFTCFTREYELMYLVMHGAWHAWFRLKWLMDIRDYPLDDFDWVVFDRLIREHHLERAWYMTRKLLAVCFDEPAEDLPAAWWMKRLTAWCLSQMDGEDIAALDDRVPLLLQMHRYHWLLSPSFCNRLNILHIALIRPGDLVAYDLPRIWMYYFIRPFSLIRRRGSLLPLRPKLLVQTLLLLVIARVLFRSQHNRPLLRIQPAPSEPDGERAYRADPDLIRLISRAIRAVSRRMPGPVSCRHQAWVAARLLKRYRQAFELFIGFKAKTPQGLEGHAWVKAGDVFVTGHCRETDYQIWHQVRWDPPRQKRTRVK